jgi:hypothetical protein
MNTVPYIPDTQCSVLCGLLQCLKQVVLMKVFATGKEHDLHGQSTSREAGSCSTNQKLLALDESEEWNTPPNLILSQMNPVHTKFL